MRLREWYGWHFPELGKIVTDNYAYGKVRKIDYLLIIRLSSQVVKAIGFRTNTKSIDLSDVVPDEDIISEV
jgi:nucleolar protein 58